MEKVQKILLKASTPYPYTAAMRNFAATSSDFSVRQVEWQRTAIECVCSIQLFRRKDINPTKPLFCLDGVGKKRETFEGLYKELFMYLTKHDFVVQGDVLEEEKSEKVSQEQNVILTAPEGSDGKEVVNVEQRHLLDWANSERFYDFAGEEAGIMGRWFPMDSVKVKVSDNREQNGGLLKTWKIPEDLIKDHMNVVNIMPIRSFMLGHFDLEFKMIVQANPFQACCIMLGTIPNPYGLEPKFVNVKGLKSDTAEKEYPYSYEKGSEFSYLDFQAAVQRPNVKLDVNTGGEATLLIKQKFHRSMIRTVDFSYVREVSAGIRGSWSSSLTLHLLSNLRVGSGSDNDFCVRIFYRFVNSQMTAMTSVVDQEAGSLKPNDRLTVSNYNELFDLRARYDLAGHTLTADQIKKFYVQGPVYSMVRTGVDVAQYTMDSIENIGEGKRKGFRTTNRDKPRDVTAVVQVVPRPRRNFISGTGVDDSLVMAVGWDEITEFFEKFSDEPTNFKQFASIQGYRGSFLWTKSQSVGTELFSWNFSPVSADGNWGLDANKLRAPLMVASSMFTNYWGTIELMFQFVKTGFHKGAVEVSIQFGKYLKGNSLESSYVKVLSVQDTSAFTVTVPYIYDTVVRPIEGTCVPYFLPSLAEKTNVCYARSSFITVKVLNELTAPSSVTSQIEVLIWMKGGTDFGLNIPRPVNTLSFVDMVKGDLVMAPRNVVKAMKPQDPDLQLTYELSDASIERSSGSEFVVQGDGDFNQGEYVANRVTTNNHTDFKTILKMPLKILSDFVLKPKKELEYTTQDGKTHTYSLKNFFFMPIAPVSTSMIHYLNANYYSARGNILKNSTSVYGCTPLQQSPQFLINQMFAMFRGSMVVTVVVKSPSVLYAAYLPHDGVLRPMETTLGTFTLFSDRRWTKGRVFSNALSAVGVGEDIGVDLSMVGLYNVMIVPGINPTERFEIPMTNSVNWLLMNRRLTFSGQKDGLQTVRENLEWFNGHLAFWSSDEVKFDVYVSAGDDLELGGFLGHPGVVNPWGTIASLKDCWRVQSDFSLKDIAQQGWKSVTGICSKLTMAGACAATSVVNSPVLRPISLGAMAFFMLGGYNEIVAFRSNIRRFDGVAQERIVSSVQTEGARLLLGVVQEAFPMTSCTETDMDKFWAAAQHIVHSALSRSWQNAAFGFFCMMVKLDVFSFSDWSQVGSGITNLFRTGEQYSVQSDDAWSSCVEIFITLFCSRMQVQASGGLKQFLLEMFQWQNYKAISGINSINMMVRNLVKAIKTIFDHLTEKKDPRIKLMKFLSAQGSDLAEFVEQATLYLNVVNESECKKKDVRIKFLRVIVQAHKIRALLIELCNPKLTAQLLSLCNDVIKKSIQQRYLFKCDLVKGEPFVLSISGASNLGKSFSTYDLAVTALKKIGVCGSMDCLFTIPAGVKYWNGYEDQPVIWYDDWCNLMDDETVREHISQLYALKTSAPFNVPRAELENKEQTANPNLVVLTTNNPFPTHPSIHFPDAVYRRRDMMVQFELKEEYKDISEVPVSVLNDFGHLNVRLYGNVLDPASLMTDKMSYQQFKALFEERLLDFHKKEMKNKEKKYKTLMSLLNKTSYEELEIGNPFDILERENFACENQEMPSQILEKEVYRLHALLRDHMEILKVRVADGDVFNVQVEEDEDETVDGRNYLLSMGGPGIPTATDKERKQHAEERYQSLDFWKRFLFKMVRAINNTAMLCSRCGCDASVRGTVFWCDEHSHYMCFHCGLVDARPFGIARDCKELFFETACCMHGSRLVIKQEGLLKQVYSTLLNAILLKPMFVITNLVGLLLGNSLSEHNWMIFQLRLMVNFLLQKVRNLKYKVQVELEDPIFTGPVATLGYAGLEKFKPDKEMVEQCRHDFDKMDLSSCSNVTVKYVCPHSLLWGGFMFREQMYWPIGTELSIPDQLCAGGCVLTNLTFLEGLKEKFFVSSDKMMQFEEGRLRTIEQYFPRFVHTSTHIEGIRRVRLVRKIVRADWWENYVFPVADKAWQFIKRMAPILAFVALLWGATKGFKVIWNWLNRVMGFEAQTFTRSEGRKQGVSSPRRDKPRYNAAFSSQSSTENLDNKLAKIAGNFVILQVGDKRLVAWGIKGSTIILPQHLVVRLRKYNEFKLEFLNAVSRSVVVLVANCDFQYFEGRDLCSVTVKGVPVLFKDCTGFLPLKGGDSAPAAGVILDVDSRAKRITEVETRIVGMRYDFSAADGEDEVRSSKVVMYDKQRPGMCGSLVCVDSIHPIYAMHIAGSVAQDRGIGILLYREDFVVQGEIEEIEDSGDGSEFYGSDCLISYEATVPRNLRVFIPQKTKIIPSLIADLLPVAVTMPAFLTGLEPGYKHEKTPLYYGVRKNGFPPRPFLNSDVRDALEVVCNLILSGRPIRTPQILDVEQSIVGLPEIVVDDPYVAVGESMYYGAIPLDTSVGYPFTTQLYAEKYGLGPKKRDWIQIEYGEDGLPCGVQIHPAIMEVHEHRMKLRQQGVITNNLFQDCLKDERRPIEKASKEGGTRLFSMSNVEGTIALRRYTLDFTSYLRYNRVKNGIAVGINPESMEWTILADTLLKNSGNVFTTDFTNFGAGLSFQCGMTFADVVSAFFCKCGAALDESSKRVLRVLIAELMGSRHVVGSLVYSTFCGSPSGAAVTVEMNSLVHLLYMVLSWILIAREIRFMMFAKERGVNLELQEYLVENNDTVKLKEASQMMSLMAFRENCVACVYGDDGIFSISDYYKDIFNAVTVNLVLKTFGIGVTDASKSEKIVAYTSLDKVTFLKRSFVAHELCPNTLYMARMDWNTVEECAKWIRKNEMSGPEATYENCLSSLMLAYGWGSERFDWWKSKLNGALDARGIKKVELTWMDVSCMFFPELTVSFL